MTSATLGPRHYAVLDVLTAGPPEEGQRPGELAHILGKRGETVSRILFDLRELGLAARCDRTFRHSITAAGREWLARHPGKGEGQ